MKFTKVSPEERRWAIMGWRLRHAFEALKKTYKSARKDADDEQADVEKRYAKFQKQFEAERGKNADDQDWIDSADAYDNHLYDAYHDAVGMQSIVMEAFVVALNHLWERSFNRLLNVEKYDEPAVFKSLSTKGIVADETKLTDLRFLANTIKHDKGHSAEKLYERRSDLFDATFVTIKDEASQEHLILTKAVMKEFFDAVENAIPKGKPMF